MSVASAGKTQQLGAGTIWRHSFPCVWCLGWDVGKPGLSCDYPVECLHMTSPYGLGFLRAWQSRGSQTYYKAQGSKGRCCSDQGGSCMVFYDSFVSYRELLLCSVSFKQVHSESRRQMVDPTSQWKECQAMCSHLKKNFYTDTPINISEKYCDSCISM